MLAYFAFAHGYFTRAFFVAGLRGGFPLSFTAANDEQSFSWRQDFIATFQQHRWADCKRLVKSPKVYVRDSGLLHALLNINDINALAGHPSAGASWEGMVVEQICALAPAGADIGFYRTAAGTELDVVVAWGNRVVGFEIKFSAAPKVTRGFWQACKDIGADAAFIVAPVAQGWPMKTETSYPVSVVSLLELDQVFQVTSP